MSIGPRRPGERHGVSVLGWVVAILAGVFLGLWVGSALGAGAAGEHVSWIGLAVGSGVGVAALALGIVLIRMGRPEKPQQTSTEPTPSPTTVVEVYRDSGWYRDGMREYRVLIDRAEVGRIRPGQTLAIGVDAGQHTIQARIDWASSRALDVDIAEGNLLRLRCRPSSGALLGLWVALLRPRSYIRLERDRQAEKAI
jgi:hypothetical protein